MSYNITNLTDNTTGVYSIVNELNTLSSGLLIGGLLITIYVVFVIAAKNRYDFKIASILASGVITGMGILFFANGWINQAILMIPILLLLGSLGFFVMSKD